VTPFRARSATELVDGAVQLLRGNYATLVTLGAVYYVPILVLQWTWIGTMRPLAPSQVGAMFARLGITWSPIIVWTAAWYALIYTVVSDLYLGRPADIRSALRRGLTRVWPTIASSILKAIGVFTILLVFFMAGVFLGSTLVFSNPVVFAGRPGVFVATTCLFFIPGLILGLYWFAAPAAAVLEPIGAVSALRRSGMLSRGHKWHVFKTYFIVACLFVAAFMLAGLIGVGISLLVQAVSGTAAETVADLAVSVGLVCVYPLWPITQTLLYYDARIRNEGYDIELLAERVGSAA
jgi:hypothetical protein